MGRQHMLDDDEEADDYCGATEDEVIESLQEEVRDQAARVEFLRRAMKQTLRWIVLYRNGDLPADAAFAEIEKDLNRCIPTDSAGATHES